MPSIIDIEKAASRLRQNLRATPIPELRLLCGLRFFALFAGDYRTGLESYLREFTSQLAEAARKSRPAEFLPEEAEGLNRFIDLIKAQTPAIVGADDISAFNRLLEAVRTGAKMYSPEPAAPKGAARVRCLFVEHYPDLDLAPRGRILDLTVTAVKIPAKAEDDDIVVRNPLYEPDDRFLAQARDSIKAARAYLHRRYGLPLKKRYRFDLAVDSSGARFTGDSLGVAFAVGAVAAVAAIEVFREKLSVAPTAAFSGALSADGKIEPIDGEALKLKIYRAFHSDLAYLVIPRQHITDAWEYLATLEKQHPGRKLELVGADDLATVVADPRLAPARRSSAPAYVARKALAARRSAWVEIPALIGLCTILLLITVPQRCMPGFEWRVAQIEVAGAHFRVINPKGDILWRSQEFPGKLDSACYYSQAEDLHWATDADRDDKDELFFVSVIKGLPGQLHYYDHTGELKWKSAAYFATTYPGDIAVLGDLQHLTYQTFNITPWVGVDDRPMIMTSAFASDPARTQIMSFDANGCVSGPYLHTGAAGPGVSQVSYMTGDTMSGILICGTNNRLERAVLGVLNPANLSGVSPPYDDARFVASTMPKGSQLFYVAFPETPLSVGEGIRNSIMLIVPDVANRRYDVTVAEGGNTYDSTGTRRFLGDNSLPQIRYTLDSKFIPIDAAFGDNQFELMNALLTMQGMRPVGHKKELEDSLMSEVIVYHGDSIVHHPAKGIRFYAK